MPLRDGVTLSDHLTVELVECQPEPPAPAPPPPPASPDASPTDQARDATIGHTGADPPPQGSR